MNGTGTVGGMLSGAGTGFAIGGPIGAGIGALVGGIYGLAKGNAANRARRAADRADANVNPIDPNITSFMSRLNQLERQYRAGSDPSSVFAKQAVADNVAQTQSNLMRMGRPQDLLRAQRQGDIGFQRVGAGAAERADRLLPLSANLAWQMSERLYNRQQQKRAAAMATAAAREQEVMNLFAMGLGTAPQIIAGMNQTGIRGGSVARSPNLDAPYAYQPPNQGSSVGFTPFQWERPVMGGGQNAWGF